LQGRILQGIHLLTIHSLLSEVGSLSLLSIFYYRFEFLAMM